jgi:hypothetical protein
MKSFSRSLMPLLLAGAFSGAAISAEVEQSTINLTPAACRSYAAWSGNLVWASDLGADKEKAKADLVARDQKAPSSIFALMLTNLDALWDTSVDWEQVTAVILQDCVKRKGVYPRTREFGT